MSSDPAYRIGQGDTVELVLAVAAVLLMASAWVGRPTRDPDAAVNEAGLTDLGFADAILVPRTIRQTSLR